MRNHVHYEQERRTIEGAKISESEVKIMDDEKNVTENVKRETARKEYRAMMHAANAIGDALQELFHDEAKWTGAELLECYTDMRKRCWLMEQEHGFKSADAWQAIRAMSREAE